MVSSLVLKPGLYVVVGWITIFMVAFVKSKWGNWNYIIVSVYICDQLWENPPSGEN